MKNREQILEKKDLQPGHSYLLRELPLGVTFTLSGGKDRYETITYPDIITTRVINGNKRDCWNLTKKRMERIEYRSVVVISKNK